MRTGVAILLLIGGVLGCGPSEDKDAFVARVGDQYLTTSHLHASLGGLARGFDSTEAAHQFIDRWITNELLYQEARRLRLESQPEIREQLEESERAVLIQAMVGWFQSQAPSSLSPVEISTYFESNKENLRLLEPFVRVRYLSTSHADSAEAVARLLNQSARTEADSVFDQLAVQFASDVVTSVTLAHNHFPERSLFADRPAVRTALAAMTPGSIAQVIESDSTWHVLQLLDRAAEGSLPELAWIEGHLREQLQIQQRKQNYISAVEILRAEADARDEIEIRY